ncbi:MAG: hypothetical protein R3B09_18760 [Nannocystaceae bacterium]
MRIARGIRLSRAIVFQRPVPAKPALVAPMAMPRAALVTMTTCQTLPKAAGAGDPGDRVVAEGREEVRRVAGGGASGGGPGRGGAPASRRPPGGSRASSGRSGDVDARVRAWDVHRLDPGGAEDRRADAGEEERRVDARPGRKLPQRDRPLEAVGVAGAAAARLTGAPSRRGPSGAPARYTRPKMIATPITTRLMRKIVFDTWTDFQALVVEEEEETSGANITTAWALISDEDQRERWCRAPTR